MSEALRPLLVATLLFLAGLLASLRFQPAPVTLLVGAVTLSVLAAATARASRPDAGLALLALAFAASGAAAGASAAHQAATDCRTRLESGEPLRFTGVLLTSSARAGGSSFHPMRGVLAGAGGSRCRTEVRVRLPDDAPDLEAGTLVVLHGAWRRAPPPIDRSPYPARPVYSGSLVADSVAAVSAAGTGRSSPVLALRAAAEARLASLFGEHGPIVEALLLGRRERMDPAVRQRFAEAGLAHLLAISGMHVGLLSGIVLLVGGTLRIPRSRRALATIAILGVYLLTIGAPASAVRAGIMISLALLALVLQRPSAILPIVAASALVILCLDPLAILDPGFQLSFAGVLGILATRALPSLRTAGPWRESPRIGSVVETAVVGGAAFLATAPIVAFHFGTVAPISIPATLPAVPLLTMALVGVLAALVVAPLSTSAATLLADGAGVALLLLDRLAEFARSLPYAHFPVDAPDLRLWTAAAAVAAGALPFLPRLRPGPRVLAAVGLAAAVLLVGPLLRSAGGGELEVHFLDVGQGDATALRTPGNRWILVDAGPRLRDVDMGERRVLPYLRAHGVRRLEVLVLTHPHADHVGGAAAVLRALEVGLVLDPGMPYPSPVYHEALEVIEREGVPWRAARTGQRFEIDGVRFELLWPDAETLDGPRDANQISAVVRATFRSSTVLLTGDAETDQEHVLAARHGRGLHATLLKAGHHGSPTSTTEPFLDAVSPRYVVISAGRGNRYGHPGPDVLARLERRGMEVARTDLEGTIRMRSTPEAPGWRRLQ